MKKRNKFEIRSTQGVALILIIIIAGYFGYNFITKVLAYSALVPKEYDASQQLLSEETVLYKNIDKTKYGNYDYIEGRRGELIVRLEDRIPLYRIAQIADQYGMYVDRKYSADSPVYILRIIDPGDDIGGSPLPAPANNMRIIDPGDDIGGLLGTRAFAAINDISDIIANDLRNQGYLIDPSVKYNTPVSSGYLEGIWKALETHSDIYSATLNTVQR